MNDLEAAKARAAATYNAAADLFDHPSNTFWDRFGQTTIDRLQLRSGQTVLDVCCGSGASALPAAEAVGAEGQLIGMIWLKTCWNWPEPRPGSATWRRPNSRRGT